MVEQLSLQKTDETNPEISLEKEWQRQADKLAKLFAGELGLTEEEYIASLPKFELQPAGFKGRFDIPLVVETRIPLERMLELAGITAYFDLKANIIKNWEKANFTTPEKPYTAWVNDGTASLGKSVNEVRSSLKADERGANIYETISLFLRNPEILKSHSLQVPDSQIGFNKHALYLYFRKSIKPGPGLGNFWPGNKYPDYGSVVAGKI